MQHLAPGLGRNDERKLSTFAPHSDHRQTVGVGILDCRHAALKMSFRACIIQNALQASVRAAGIRENFYVFFLRCFLGAGRRSGMGTLSALIHRIIVARSRRLSLQYTARVTPLAASLTCAPARNFVALCFRSGLFF
jgi:hypothetical protein